MDQSKLAENWFQQLCFPIWMIFLIMTSSWSSSIILLMAFLPVVSATTQDPFPDLPFQAFAEFVQENFSSKVSLATVVLLQICLEWKWGIFVYKEEGRYE